MRKKEQKITGYEMFLFELAYEDYDNALIDVLWGVSIMWFSGALII